MPRYHLIINGSKCGPYTEGDVKKLAEQGDIDSTTYCLTENETVGWKPVTSFFDLPTLPTQSSATGETRVPIVKIPTRICPKCSTTLDDDASYCPSCRTPTTSGAATRCPRCGKSIGANSTFCKYCAADLSPAPRSDMPPPIAKGDPGAGLIVLGAMIAIVSAVAYLWGANYAGNFSNAMSAGFSNVVGRRDPTYDLAALCVNFGPFTFLAGIILLVAGFIIRHRR